MKGIAAGPTMDAGKIWDDFAKSLSKTRDELTSQEKKQAILNHVLLEEKERDNESQTS